MSTLTQDQRQELEQALLEQRKDLQHHFESSMEDGAPAESLKNSTGELSSYDNHPADAGTETFERSRDLAIDDTLTDEFNQVNDALERMEEGTYGTCVSCRKEIPFERLQAIPYTTYCIDHASNRDVSNDRPVEEEVMTMPPSGAGEVRQRNAGKFDNAEAWEAVEAYGTSNSPAMAAKRDVQNYDENM
ncbi:TraR/DksA C4-type zinc finger protein [Paenibacillus barcinonensis]|uniref:TraR/DksA C4-type zinc finger protein n=1 Tax=Paenibacillus barcinonensis TaxID=198119 RepID=A0A2V4VWG7_PAEBA|nr:TraR/DksA C4-type zinc finger protein [Paenibacillus barcinonensis]PYE52075.1 TraR/DksA family transcriptional regulator [Paenibacillus barcinonensis]QKS59777.1 TraR/DksA C4-type zinc finger protein [Paenibacillus barcinonensis]